jgi:hypothetical protein
MNRFVISIFLVLMVSCQTNSIEWKTIDFNAFKLQVPKDWKKFKEPGIDAYTGGVTNGKDTLWFYYGRYISGPKPEDVEKYLYAQDTINGLTSVIQIPKKANDGIIELFIPYVNDEVKFSLAGSNIQSTGTILNIFKSVTFDVSDTIKNGTLTKNKFKEFLWGSGCTVFTGLCSYCHDLQTSGFAPALIDTLQNKNSKWLYNFLKAKEPIIENGSVINSTHKNIQWFDNMTMTDVEQLIGYIKGK